MQYKCILQRVKEFDSVQKRADDCTKEPSTIGKFEVYAENGKCVLECYCVENGGESTDTPNLDKRIVAREYKLKWTTTSIALPRKYKNKDKKTGQGLLLYTDELPSFEKRRILIHIGNYPQDTLGCLLLCKYWNGKTGYANNSTLAVEAFYDLVAKEGVENFTLEIREIEK